MIFTICLCICFSSRIFFRFDFSRIKEKAVLKFGGSRSKRERSLGILVRTGRVVCDGTPENKRIQMLFSRSRKVAFLRNVLIHLFCIFAMIGTSVRINGMVDYLQDHGFGCLIKSVLDSTFDWVCIIESRPDRNILHYSQKQTFVAKRLIICVGFWACSHWDIRWDLDSAAKTLSVYFFPRFHPELSSYHQLRPMKTIITLKDTDSEPKQA